MVKRKTDLMLTAFMAVLALMIANGTSRGA
jgi:hypothetical protein